MKKNILLRTNILVCLIIVAGFLVTAVLSYQANYSASIENIEQVSRLTSEGVYYQMSSTFTKPVNVSLTMANDSLLKDYLSREEGHLEEAGYIDILREYLKGYQAKYGYDSVFLVSAATGRYYNFNGLDRVLVKGDPENAWYYDGLLNSKEEYSMNVDNDEVAGAENEITVFVNCKIKDSSGNLLGAVGVGVRIDSLQGMLQQYQDDFGVNAYLINNAGTIEISTEYTGFEERNLFEIDNYGEEACRTILSWKEAGIANSFWNTDETGAKRDYVVARYLPELQWHLVVERDTSFLMRDLNRQLIYTVLVILLIIGVILYVITHVMRSFNRQIVSLTQSVEQERRTMFERATEELYENIYELDITHNRPANRSTEQYFESLGAPPGTPFDKALHIIADKQIKKEFRAGYVAMFSPENVQKAYQEGRDTLKYEFMISQNGQDYYWMRITARLIIWENDQSLHMLTYRQNIDTEKKKEYRMQELAQTDEMTGLLTKTATQHQIESCLQQNSNRQYAFFIFDIDHFKQANDCFGHAFGDGVIREFTKPLRLHFREADLLGRLGGDAFAVFLPVKEEVWAENTARELGDALNRLYIEGEKSWQMSTSIGVAFAPKDGTDFKTLYQHADAALYQTKERGRFGYTLYEKEKGGSI